MAKMDGSEKLAPVPYDAHEQVVRKPHTHSREEGYQPLKPVEEEKEKD